MKIYTRGGDAGQTSRGDGTRVSKDDSRVDAYGEVDELCAVLGLCRAEADSDVAAALARIQSDLFSIGAVLANPEPRKPPATKVTDALSAARIGELESEIDGFEAELSPLRQFILPGGSALGARLHHARAVCRRAERAVVSLRQHSAVPDSVLAYVNRLSDWLFVAARLANQRAGSPEIPW